MLLRASTARGSRALVGLALLAATLGCATWYAVSALGRATVAATERLIGEGALPSLVLTGPDPALRAAVLSARDSPQVRAELPRARFAVDLTAEDGDSLTTTLVAMQMAQEVMLRPGRVKIVGRLPRDGEVMLEERTAARLGVGMEGEVAARAEPYSRLKVVGTFRAVGGALALPSLGLVTFATLAGLRGADRIDAVEVVFAGDVDLERAADDLARRIDASIVIRPTELRQLAGGAVRALRTTIDLAGWIALCISAFAVAAAARDRVRARAADLALQRAIGVPPHWITLQAIAPLAVLGAVAGVVGSGIGVLLALALVPGVQAWTSLQLGSGVVLPAPRLGGSDLAIAAALGASVTTLAAWLGARAVLRAEPAVVLSGADTQSGVRLSGRTAMLGAVGLAGSAAIALSGATAVHVAFRALDVVFATVGVALLAPHAAALCVQIGTGKLHALAKARVMRAPGGLVPATRLLAVCGTFVVALLGVRSNLAVGVTGEAERRFPGTEAWVSGVDLMGVDLGAPVPIDQETRRTAFRDMAALALDVTGEFVAILAVLGLLATAAFVIAEVRERGREHALLHALGASPGVRVRVAMASHFASALGALLLAILGGNLLSRTWTLGPLRDTLGWIVPWAPFDAAALLPAGFAAVALTAVAALVAATDRRLTAS